MRANTFQRWHNPEQTPRVIGDRGRRWPPEDRSSPETGGAWTGAKVTEDTEQPDHVAPIGDLSKLLAELAPSKVLGTATYLLSTLGQATDNYRIPFRAIAIANYSANRLTLTNSPPQQSAPGAGPGVTIIPPMAFRVVNLAGYSWTVYGGNAGDPISVEVFTRPQPPAASSIAGPQTTGIQTLAEPAAPAAGIGYQFAITQASQLLTAAFTLTTSATVANRFATITITDALANLILTVNDNTATVASTNVRLLAAIGLTQANNAVGVSNVPLPEGLILMPGWLVNLTANGLQAGDTITNISYVLATL